MTEPPFRIRPLAYEAALVSRSADDIDLVVIHCTELPDLDTARIYGKKIHYPETGTGNSGHFYIDRDGSIEQWISPLRVAHHVAGHNEPSIGIELVNRGRYPDWLHSSAQQMTEVYPDEQISALIGLLRWLCGEYSTLSRMAGHAELDRRTVPASDQPDVQVRRKIDPGPLFPWSRVSAAVPLLRQA